MARPLYAVLVLIVALTACSGGDGDSDTAAGGASPAKPAAGTRLYLAGDGELAVLDVASGRVQPRLVPELAGGDPPYRIVRRRARLVLYGGDTYVTDMTLSTPTRLHTSWFFIPSAVEDRVWVALLDPESPDTVRALSGVAELTTDGVVTVAPVRPPGGRWPVGDTTSGLLFERPGGGLDVWDPAARAVVRRLPDAWHGPTHGDLLAWCALGGKRAGELLHLTDVSTATVRWQAGTPAGFTAFACAEGAFSPDGQTLALPVARADPYGPSALALVEVGTGEVRIVPRSQVPGGYVFVTWASSGDEVFLTGGDSEPRTVAAYRLGDEHARRLTVDAAFYGVAAS